MKRSWFANIFRSFSRRRQRSRPRRFYPELEFLEHRIVPQATQTWVSGVGDDFNAGTRALPDKTFAVAISNTAAGGEIDALDAGGFGALTITKAITIDGSGTFAGVLVSGTNAFVVAAGASDVVIIRGLDFNGIGSGLVGIKITSAAAVYIEDCTIENFTGAAIDFEPTNAGAQLIVSNCHLDNNAGGGVLLAPNGVTASASLDHVNAFGNQFGVLARDNVTATISNSDTSGNTQNGIQALSANANVLVNLQNDVASNNGANGVLSQGASSHVVISSLTATGNSGMGTQTLANGTLSSFGNNLIADNSKGFTPITTSLGSGGGPVTRTWVSGFGSDLGADSRVEPGATLANALTKVMVGGEINAVDPGDFGPVTISHSILINGTGTLAGITAGSGTLIGQSGPVTLTATNAIVINAASTDVVTIRGLTLQGNGSGLAGIKIVSAGAVYIEDCTIENFAGAGIDFEPTNSGAQLFVVNSTLDDNAGGGVLIKPNGGTARAVLDGVTANGNKFAVEVDGSADVTVSNSSASGSTQAGFQAGTQTAGAIVNLQSVTAANNGTNGVSATGAGTVVTYANLTATGNSGAGTSSASGGALNASGNNLITDNSKGFTPITTSLGSGSGDLRSWVSGVGDDTASGSRTAANKTLAGAISKTAAGGEIDAVDPGGFGALTITKSITIDGSATLASVLTIGTNGIVIAAASTDVVILRGFTFQGEGSGTGLAGIKIVSAGAVYIEDCDIENFSGAGIDFEPTNAGAELFVVNTTLDNNGGGVLIKPNGGTAQAVLDGVTANGNKFGVEVDGSADVTVSNSSASGSTQAGFQAGTQTAGAIVNLQSVTAANNGTNGVSATGAGTVVNYANLTATGNSGAATSSASGGALNASGNNVITDNSKGFTPITTSPGSGGGFSSRTWVSGSSVASDSNPGSRIAPDLTLAVAFSHTVAGGEIDALDPGSFGTLTITQSLTIDANNALASVQVSGNNGIVIAAPSTAVVIIRGFSFNGLGSALAGIKITSAATVYIEDCTIQNFTGAAIDFEPTNAGAQLIVSNCQLDNNAGGGVLIKPNGVAARAVINGVEVKGGGVGVEVADQGDATVSNSNAAGASGAGFEAVAGSVSSILDLEGSVSTNNTNGVFAQGPVGGSSTISATVNAADLNVVANSGAALLTATSTPTDSFINQLFNVESLSNTLSITSANSVAFSVGLPNTFRITTSTNGSPPSLSFSGTLPGGVNFSDNHDGTATLSGPGSSTGTFTFSITAHNGEAPDAIQNFSLSVNVLSVTSSSTIHDAGGTTEFIQFANGSVYRHFSGNSTLSQLINPNDGSAALAISAGLDQNNNADVAVEYADQTLWVHTGTVGNSGWTQLTGGANDNSQLAPGTRTIKMFVAGMGGVVNVVFTDTTFWKINLTSPSTPTEAANKAGVVKTGISFVAVGLHNGQEADYVAFLDSGPTTNGGVWLYVGPGVAWISVTGLDAYAISASWDMNDTADIIVSSRNASGIVDHSVWGWRGTAGSLIPITSSVVSSIAVNANGDDFYVLQSTGSIYLHRNGDPITTVTALVTGSPTPVTAIYGPNVDLDTLDFLFSNGTLWQLSGITTLSGTPNLQTNPLAS